MHSATPAAGAPHRPLRRSRAPRVARAATLAACLAASVAACVSPGVRPTPQRTMRASYSTALVEVARPIELGAPGDGPVRLTLGDSLRYVYADSLVEIRAATLHDRIALAITNRTDHAIAVLWDDAAYADVDGALGKVMHTRPRRPDGAAPQRPSVIPARRTLTDVVLPASRVVHRAGSEGPFGWRRGYWASEPLIAATSATLSARPDSPDDAQQRAAFLADVESMMGKRFGVVLPLRSQGTASEYTLWFSVQGAVVE